MDVLHVGWLVLFTDCCRVLTFCCKFAPRRESTKRIAKEGEGRKEVFFILVRVRVRLRVVRESIFNRTRLPQARDEADGR